MEPANDNGVAIDAVMGFFAALFTVLCMIVMMALILLALFLSVAGLAFGVSELTTAGHWLTGLEWTAGSGIVFILLLFVLGWWTAR